MLTNLLGNALLATTAGGRVTVTAHRAGHRSEAVVADTGVGLAPDDLGASSSGSTVRPGRHVDLPDWASD